MRSSTPTISAFVLLLPALAGVVAGAPGCGSTIVEATGGSTASSSGVGASGAGNGPATASSGHAVASAASSGTGGGGTGGGGTGGSAPCGASEKSCFAECVAVDDPAYGCTATSCAACPPSPNASQACMAGACALGACDSGFKNCDGDPANGCETSIQDDPANCGACGASCTIPHATPACDDGVCIVGVCDSGWTDCNLDPMDGCEANLQNDPMNCGACGNTCSLGEVCEEGGCAGGCVKGEANCPGDPANVCATELGTNKNCNFCGDTCDLANATSQCQPDLEPPPEPDFVCKLETCNAGFADCDQIAANGCETNTGTDPNNCGACGNVCDLPNAVAGCENGSCAIFVCNAGFADCNHVTADGCEVDLDTDPNNCGGCMNVCATTCSGGVCAP